MRLRERNNYADTKISEERGKGGAPGSGAEIPLQLMVETMVRKAVPLQTVQDTTLEQVGDKKRL